MAVEMFPVAMAIDAGDAIAGFALLFAIISFLLSFYSTSVAGRRARMPALVFVFDLTHRQWVLRNVGNGPALDVVVAQRTKGMAGQWYRPVRVPPLGKDDQFLLWWLESSRDFGLGARYHDMVVGDSRALRHVYVTRTGDDISRIYQGHRSRRIDMPQWQDSDIQRHWQIEQRAPGAGSGPEEDRGRVTKTPGSAG
jgi:hypothetical protein